VTTAKKAEAKAKRRSEMTVEARLVELEREVERLKANLEIHESFKVRVEGMLRLLSKRAAP
jgi:hypothetical protein